MSHITQSKRIWINANFLWQKIALNFLLIKKRITKKQQYEVTVNKKRKTCAFFLVNLIFTFCVLREDDCEFWQYLVDAVIEIRKSESEVLFLISLPFFFSSWSINLFPSEARVGIGLEMKTIDIKKKVQRHYIQHPLRN